MASYAMGVDAPLYPPVAWFAHPGSIPTDRRITVTDEGQVYGYIALWDTCHVGMPGCLKPPKGSPTDYGYAHTGMTRTAEGIEVPTANIGGGAGHAPLDHGAPPEFYENTSTQLARVRYGEDENGLWFAGAVWPDADDMDVEKLRGSALSGDWRWVASWRQASGEYDFAGACLVNIPGYPMEDPGGITDRYGKMTDLVASAQRGEGASFLTIVADVKKDLSSGSSTKTTEAPGRASMCDCQCKNEPVVADAAPEPVAEEVIAKLNEVLALVASMQSSMMKDKAEQIARMINE